MGCAMRQKRQQPQKIIKIEITPEKKYINPHAEDLESEEIYSARPNARKSSLGMDVASKILANERKSETVDITTPSQTFKLIKHRSATENEKSLNFHSNSLIQSPLKEKISFYNHEHKFDFDFVEIKSHGFNNQDHNEIDEILAELNNLN